MTEPAPTLAALGAGKFVQLTTFRKDGTPVPTPVWAVVDGPDLLVVTDVATGKVKRIRHTPRVLVVPCGMRGAVEPGAPEVEATAAIVTDQAEVRRLISMIKKKYPVLGRILGIRIGKKVPTGETIEIRISPAA